MERLYEFNLFNTIKQQFLFIFIIGAIIQKVLTFQFTTLLLSIFFNSNHRRFNDNNLLINFILLHMLEVSI